MSHKDWCKQNRHFWEDISQQSYAESFIPGIVKILEERERYLNEILQHVFDKDLHKKLKQKRTSLKSEQMKYIRNQIQTNYLSRRYQIRYNYFFKAIKDNFNQMKEFKDVAMMDVSDDFAYLWDVICIDKSSKFAWELYKYYRQEYIQLKQRYPHYFL